MVMLARFGQVAVLLRFNHRHAARHPQMDQQHLPVIQIGHHIFCPSGQLIHPPPGQLCDKIVGKRGAQIGATLHDRGQNPSFHNRGKAPTNCFDFWQFRHHNLVTALGGNRKQYVVGNGGKCHIVTVTNYE